MPAIYQFLGTHEVLIYILLLVGALFGMRWLWRSWNEWREAAYNLEKEFALRRIGQAMVSLGLILMLFFAELFMASFIYPNLPATLFVATRTPDLLATPTGTISPELATAIALTPRQVTQSDSEQGCVSDRVAISTPRAGTELNGTVDIRGTANIPNFGFYKYEVAPAGSEAWATIAAGRETIRDGSLGQWDTAAVAPGDYQLRLVVTDNQGRAQPACIINVRVAPPG
jgi:hypothetical protein